ncbi:hypothetical protein E2R23_11885 [Burkholderia pseudomallei]|nr:hypothetical protein EXY28_11825 [Burkholderia pseudomallei]QBI47994.1 hypothetical protein EXY72_11880 [Burkholderia pseudomallei]QBL79278.1 hypothetical protein EYA82_11800 [Burkholderia pseudomallei]QBL85898.1 hypothetical protein EYA88_11695 [Burkholderia pseudomallei]QBP49751.1 hypothetical protein E2R28_11795 [Burkholderia pseudomallei]
MRRADRLGSARPRLHAPQLAKSRHTGIAAPNPSRAGVWPRGEWKDRCGGNLLGVVKIAAIARR